MVAEGTKLYYLFCRRGCCSLWSQVHSIFLVQYIADMQCTMIYSLDFNQNHKSDERKLHYMRYFGRIAIELERHVLISQITRNLPWRAPDPDVKAVVAYNHQFIRRLFCCSIAKWCALFGVIRLHPETHGKLTQTRHPPNMHVIIAIFVRELQGIVCGRACGI